MQILHSKILGQGKPLCILHGFLGMSDNWKSLGNKFAVDGFEVHLIDQRNHGKSFWSEVFNYEEMAKDLKDYMEFHRLNKADFIGHSMGGKTVMEFSCNYPHLVGKLIIADIAPKYYPPHHKHILDAVGQLDLKEIDSRNKANMELEKYLKDFGIRQFLLKNLYWKDKKQLAFRFNLAVLQNKMEEIGSALEDTEQFQGSTLFIRGGDSDYIQKEDLENMKKHFPHMSLDTIANAGHWLHAEKPDAFYLQSLAFLNS
ncbi:alpha/beta fold hydrolase [Eudoraea chungangensis]|uniref:alpha/beta fold hydrolase n=1 Tax=Eudoraea chungangensis TaxID=1481905 RepID=UPI0023EB6735|nr:alpha/beta fold hydrolase [Eudoraea chungangensis]